VIRYGVISHKAVNKVTDIKYLPENKAPTPVMTAKS
jgi:hypothetical protein